MRGVTIMVNLVMDVPSNLSLVIPSCMLQCPGLDPTAGVHLIGQFIDVRPWPNMLVISRTGLLGSRLGVGFDISPLKDSTSVTLRLDSGYWTVLSSALM